ncbi:MAG: GlsB/YeaQ/YmgE family stress response membrane protein [Egibacteraceae bacterium]
MLGTIILFVVIGLIAGALARLLVPGPDPMSVLATIALGIVGSFIGGTLWTLLSNEPFSFRSSGWIGSIIGAIILVLLLRAFRRRRVA